MSIPSGWRYTDSYEYMQRVRSGFPPVIICCACNGGLQGREYNAAIPETPQEIAEAVAGAYEAGASMVHVHARDPGYLPGPAKRVEDWREVNDRIRERCPDIIINNTTGGGPGMTDEERLASLDVQPEMASLNLVPDMSRFTLKERAAPLPHPRPPFEYDDCWPVWYKLVTWFATEMKERGIKPELETYHPGGAWVIHDLIQQGLVEKPYWIQTVMGYQTSSYPTAQHVLRSASRLSRRHHLALFGDRPVSVAHDDARVDPRRPRARGPRGQRLLPPGRAGAKQRAARGTCCTARTRARPRSGHASAGAADARPGRDGQELTCVPRGSDDRCCWP